MKITEKMLENQFNHLCGTLGTSWELENIPEYNGYQITNSSDNSKPFGHERYSKTELFYMIKFALRAIQIERNGEKDVAFWPSLKKPENYICSFTGRRKDAIGAFYSIHTEVQAESEAHAELKLYDIYDHILQLKIEKA